MRLRSIVCSDHVGREREIATMAGALLAARDHGRVLCIGGEAGVGKSRLCRDLIDTAERNGCLVLRGACVEGGDASRGPIAHALRRYLTCADEGTTNAILDSPARLALTLVPELVDPDNSVSLTGLGPEHIGVALWHLIDRLGSRQSPVLLVVEDVHWADADTLRLLRELAREIEGTRALLVLTYRSDELHRRHPLLPVLAELRRLRGSAELTLEPLDREQTRTFLSCCFSGAPIGDELLDAVRGRTGGNPFFTEELCRAMVERGHVVEGTDGWNRRRIEEIAIPESVLEVVTARLEPLPEDIADLLRLAAVAGCDIDVAVIAAAAGVEPTAVEHAVAAGIDHQLVAEYWEPTGPRYSLRHALTREALAGEIVGPQRQHAHQRIAEALRARNQGNLDAVAGEIAEHFARAGMIQEAGEFSLLAARDAACRGAVTTSAEQFERALLARTGEVEARIDLLLEAALSTFSQTDRRAAVAFAREARDLAARIGDPVREARALQPLWRDRWWSGQSDDARKLNERALALVAGRDDATEALCLHHLTRGMTLSDRVSDDIYALIDRGIELAGRTGDLAVLAEFHNTLGLLAVDPEIKRVELDEAVRLARRAGHRSTEVVMLANAGSTNLWSSTLPVALGYLAESVEVSLRHVPASAAYSLATRAWALALSGDLDAALETAAQVVHSSAVPSRMVALTAMSEVHLARGDVAEAREAARQTLTLAETSGEPQRVVPALALLGRAELAAETGQAIPLMERALAAARPAVALTHAAHWLVSPDLARALVVTGDGERLRRLVDDLVDWAPTMTNRAALALTKAIAAEFRGDRELALAHATEAVELYGVIGYQLREAEATILRAVLSAAAGDVTGARADAERVQRIAVRLQSPSLNARAGGVLRRLGVVTVARRRQALSPGGLSERELEVARLVAAGLSNAQIGRSLFLSERTAGNHVSNILAKLDMNRRSQVAAWAAGHGLVNEGDRRTPA